MTHPIPLFDAHCDTVLLCGRDGRSLRENPGHLDLRRLGRYAKAAQVFALFVDGGDYPREVTWLQCRSLHEVFLSELEKNSDLVTFCPGGRGIRQANEAGKIAALLSIEGGELLRCEPEKLETAAQWGVRSINVTWNHRNDLAGSHTDHPEQGLTDLGRAWIQESQRLGILADVSHLSDAAFWDIMEMTGQPVIATHSNSRAVCGHTRNLTDDMFQAICQTGGVAGLNFYTGFVGGRHSMEDVIRHVDHFMELGGAKHLALGADLDGCDELAGGMKGAEDMPMLWNALKTHGYDDATLEDIFYNNLLRVMGQ